MACEDDDFDFPPTAHPGRELFTASLFVLLVLALLVWGGWKLISLTSAPRRAPPHRPGR
jgi:TRAP-type C4-dicarboxylate transport system permease small subunit